MTGSPILALEHSFDAPVGAVFHAWSAPEVFAGWSWGSLARNASATIDFRVGGSFRSETDSKKGERWSFTGTYLEIEPDRRIVHTLEWQAPVGYDPTPEQVEVNFRPEGPGTVVRFTHTGIPDEDSAAGHREGWQNTFETLTDLLKSEN